MPSAAPERATPLARYIVETTRTAGITMREAARRGHLDEATLRYYTRTGGWSGKRPIPQDVAQKIADAIGVDVQRVLEKVAESTGDAGVDNLTADQRIVLNAMAQLDRPGQRVLADVVLTVFRELQRRAQSGPSRDGNNPQNA